MAQHFNRRMDIKLRAMNPRNKSGGDGKMKEVREPGEIAASRY
jgi:hypothetical protein